MGIAAALFYDSKDADKQTLHRRIKPTDEQVENQQERWHALAEHLKSSLSEASGKAVSWWLQGSYKFKTQLRPIGDNDEFDIDLGIYFEWQGEADDGDKGPRELKKMVQKALRAYDDDEVQEVVEPPKPRCSRVRFDGQFHIDIPCYHLDRDRDVRSLATEANEWEPSDPKAIYVWFRDLFDEGRRAKVRRQVRYLKAWAAMRFSEGKGRPSSILLTVLVAEACVALSDDEMASDDDALLAVIKNIVDRLEDNDEVANPVDPYEMLSDRLTDEQQTAFLNALIDFRTLAQNAVDAQTILESSEVWTQAYGYFFPPPDADQINAAVRNALVPVAFTPVITATAYLKADQSKKWQGTNSLPTIPKGCEIHFELANADQLPAHAIVSWTVRNAGTEAENLNDLGHPAGVGLRPKGVETSKYKGTHYMDCSVRLHGRVIGFTRVKVPISGADYPARNPRKPKYTKWI